MANIGKYRATVRRLGAVDVSGMLHKCLATRGADGPVLHRRTLAPPPDHPVFGTGEDRYRVVDETVHFADEVL